MATTYKDDQVDCGVDALTIKHYYFPLGSKHVPYSSIRSVDRLELTGLNAVRRWRIWGSGDFIHWWNLDPKRPSKTVALVLNVGKRVRPTITPDDVDAAERVLRSHVTHVSL